MNIEEENIDKKRRLISYIRTQNLMDDDILIKAVQECRKTGITLASFLIQQHLLPIEKLSLFLKTTTQETSLCDAKKNNAFEIKLGVKNKNFGKYVLLEEIARGGMGIVYKALQKDIKRIVALKIFTHNEKQKKRFFREVKAAGMLNHPNIVPVYEAGECDGMVFFTMEYIEGYTLDTLLKKKDYFEKYYTQALNSYLSITKALYFAHQNKIVHRDLKPSNILISTNKVAFLADFGLAKIMDNDTGVLTKSNEIIGTSFFMSPEQVQGKKIDHRSDIFSFGVVLYQILTLKMPFEGASLLSLYKKILYEYPTDPQKYNTNISNDFKKICLKCLQKEKALRYQSAEKLAIDLENAMLGRNIRKIQISDYVKKTYYLAKNNILLFLLLLTIGMGIFLTKQKFFSINLMTSKNKMLVQSEKLISQHKYSEAKILLDKILENDKKCANAFAKQARVYYALGKKNDSFNAISKAILLEPIWKFIQMKGDWLIAEKLYGEALATYRLSPKIKEAKIKIVDSLFLLNKLKDALSDCKTLLKEYPNDDEVKFLLCKIYYKQKKYHLSLENLTKIENLSQSLKGQMYYFFGLIYKKQQKYSLAIINFRKALTFGIFENIYFELGNCLVIKKKYIEAIPYLKKAIKNNSTTELHELMAMSFLEIKQYPKAIYYYTKCIIHKPWKVDFYLKRSICYDALRDLDSSTKDLLKANQLDPYNINPLRNLYNNLSDYKSIEKRFFVQRILSNLLLLRYQEISVDLFEKEKLALTIKHVKNYNKKQILIKIPEQQKVEKFLQIISKNTSEEVTRIAIAAIEKLYFSSKVLKIIHRYVKKYNDHKILNNLYKKMLTQNIIFEKKRMRQLLVRYYVLKDIQAIRELFFCTTLLDKIVKDNENTDIIRFFAITALDEIKTVRGHTIIKKMTNSSDPIVRLLSNIIIKKNNNSFNLTEKVIDFYPKTPFLQTLYIKHIVQSSKKLCLFLENPNTKVRLIVASKLWKRGYLAAKSVFISSFSDKNPLIRGYAHVIFWQFLKKFNTKMEQRMTKKYFPYLVRATKDATITVQRIAILRMTELKNINIIKIIQPLFENPDEFIKIQVLVALGVKGEIRSMMNFSRKNSALYLPASLFIVSRIQDKDEIKNLALFSTIQQTLDNPDPILTPFIFQSIGKSKVGNRYLFKFLDRTNLHISLGVLLGLYRKSKKDHLSKIEKFLDHPSELLRNAAAFTIMQICIRRDETILLKKYHKLMIKKHLKASAAYAYVYDLKRDVDIGDIIFKYRTTDLNIIHPMHINKTYLHMTKMYKKKKSKYLSEVLYFRKATILEPKHPDNLLHMALLLHVGEKYEEALFFMEKLGHLKKGPVYYYCLAHIHYGKKNYKLALSMLEQCEEFYFSDAGFAALKWYVLSSLKEGNRARYAKKRLDIMNGNK